MTALFIEDWAICGVRLPTRSGVTFLARPRAATVGSRTVERNTPHTTSTTPMDRLALHALQAGRTHNVVNRTMGGLAMIMMDTIPMMDTVAYKTIYPKSKTNMADV